MKNFKTRELVLVGLMAALTAVGAWIKIPLPFTPVPFTLQVFFVLLAGIVLGPSRGAASLLVYLLLGVVGLPVFAGGSAGIGVIFGPTGGYLISYPIAAAVTGFLSKSNRPTALKAIAPFLGIVIIYALGVAQLAAVKKIGLVPAVVAGALPFMPFDAVKALFALVVGDRLKVAGVINLEAAGR